MLMLENLQSDALCNLESWCFGRESLGFIEGTFMILHFFPESTFHFKILVNSGQGISWMVPDFFLRFILLSEKWYTIEMGSSSFWISLYSLILTIRSRLSSTSLLVFFLHFNLGTFSDAYWMHLVVYCKAFEVSWRFPEIRMYPFLPTSSLH